MGMYLGDLGLGSVCIYTLLSLVGVYLVINTWFTWNSLADIRSGGVTAVAPKAASASFQFSSADGAVSVLRIIDGRFVMEVSEEVIGALHAKVRDSISLRRLTRAKTAIELEAEQQVHLRLLERAKAMTGPDTEYAKTLHIAEFYDWLTRVCVLVVVSLGLVVSRMMYLYFEGPGHYECGDFGRCMWEPNKDSYQFKNLAPALGDHWVLAAALGAAIFGVIVVVVRNKALKNHALGERIGVEVRTELEFKGAVF